MTKGNSQWVALPEEQRQCCQSAVRCLALRYLPRSQIPTLLSTLPTILLSPPFILPFPFLLILISSLLPFSLRNKALRGGLSSRALSSMNANGPGAQSKPHISAPLSKPWGQQESPAPRCPEDPLHAHHSPRLLLAGERRAARGEGAPPCPAGRSRGFPPHAVGPRSRQSTGCRPRELCPHPNTQQPSFPCSSSAGVPVSCAPPQLHPPPHHFISPLPQPRAVFFSLD